MQVNVWLSTTLKTLLEPSGPSCTRVVAQLFLCMYAVFGGRCITHRTLSNTETFNALAHPLRVRILDLLKLDGACTASMLSEKLDQKVGNISHHLKILAKADLIQEVPELARDKRERWWISSAPKTRWSRYEFADDSGAVEAALLAEHVQLQQQFERAARALKDIGLEDPWAEAAFTVQSWLKLNPAELSEFQKELIELLTKWQDKLNKTDASGRESVYIFTRAFPSKP